MQILKQQFNFKPADTGDNVIIHSDSMQIDIEVSTQSIFDLFSQLDDEVKSKLLNEYLDTSVIKPSITPIANIEYRNPAGQLHRVDGPAIEYVNGYKSVWWLNGELHREDGPAIEYAGGDKLWFLNDELHREDGPAVEYVNGYKEWYLYGIEYSEEEFNKKIKG